MDISRFALGIRFDLPNMESDEAAFCMIIRELTKVLTVKQVEGLHILGGKFKISDFDNGNIYTLIIMNGSLKQMRILYRAISSDAILRSMMDLHHSYVQNNVIRNFSQQYDFGIIDEHGLLSGSAFKDVRFKVKTEKRTKFDEKGCIVVAPDSFKGTFSSVEITRSIACSLRKVMPEKKIIPVPVADGGEGTVDVVANALSGQLRRTRATSPEGTDVEATYFVVDGTKAVIEMAQASGLGLVKGDKDALHSTSKGTGELIMRALNEGVTDVYIGLGGSATNDCGVGAASALGFQFLDGEGNRITDAVDMSRIVKIDDTGVSSLVRAAKFTVMCDVTNPLIGLSGSTYVYGPQKGVDDNTYEILESGMRNMGQLFEKYSSKSICYAKGSGAAGGMGAMMMALLDAQYVGGADAILNIVRFDTLLESASIIITGEGCVDATSSSGKTVGRIIERAQKAGVPVAVLAGCIASGAAPLLEKTIITEVCSESNKADDMKEAKKSLSRALEKLAQAVKSYLES